MVYHGWFDREISSSSRLKLWSKRPWHFVCCFSFAPWILVRYTYQKPNWNMLKYIETGWWFGKFGLLFPSYWECHHPTDELIFFRGVGIPPIYWNMFVTRTNFAVAVTRAPYRRGFMSLTGWPEMMRSPWLFPHGEETLHAKWLKLEKPPRIICFWLELGVQVVT